MKRLFVFSTILFVISTSCGPVRQTASPEMNIKIRVDYREETSTRQSILQLLRMGNSKDLVTSGDGTERSIEAIFPDVTPASFAQIERIEEQIRRIPGVFYVELMRPSRPIMETLRNPKANWE